VVVGIALLGLKIKRNNNFFGCKLSYYNSIHQQLQIKNSYA
jgi:hypothetical protein